jgi:hypothetical protein
MIAQTSRVNVFRRRRRGGATHGLSRLGDGEALHLVRVRRAVERVRTLLEREHDGLRAGELLARNLFIRGPLRRKSWSSERSAITKRYFTLALSVFTFLPPMVRPIV